MKVTAVALAAVVGLVPALAQVQPFIGLLPELGRCPVWWEQPTTIPLTSEPHEALFAVPRGGNEIWYGMLQLGSSEDIVVHIAFWPGDGGVDFG
ncbi:MAG: hypothetical protein PHZ19_11905 [Candidatus Thermoplasmatota archaeon]|jgi:hypothetical protein|nr:hypothetical protein [Candidatus Thermoplasmatota archaeon]